MDDPWGMRERNLIAFARFEQSTGPMDDPGDEDDSDTEDDCTDGFFPSWVEEVFVGFILGLAFLGFLALCFNALIGNLQ